MQIEIIYKNGASEIIYNVEKLRVTPVSIIGYNSGREDFDICLNLIKNFDIVHLDNHND